ncbi:MAG: S8 family peptidase, partial [Gammaproteobacteria bacterium]|nr:S8 family peptidase [Gammaproteobacteria bacterium]
GSDRSADGRFVGVAPGANLVAVRAFDAQGAGRYIDVIKAIGWIIAHRDEFDIRVLNLSFSGDTVSEYWADPLNQAVMRAWQHGIVVVAAAGNSGPELATIGVPGNVPYIITVGAMTDNYTPLDESDDALASFSAAGPTLEGFVKPEVVAPGGHIWGLMPRNSWISEGYPQFRHPDADYFNMSGTSQAAAIVSGVVALMLQQDPSLQPDDVKCRLLTTARPAVLADGIPAYSILQQGAGLVDAAAATYATDRGCANLGINVGKDVAGTEHYRGPVQLDANGNYYIVDEAARQVVEGDGLIWSRGTLWGRGNLWGRSLLWGRSQLASEIGTQTSSSMLMRSMTINAWVDPE